jgi:hypothetical protein
MDKDTFLTTLRAERQGWTALFRQADPRLHDRPGVVGEWTLVDLLAHVSAYEGGLVEWLQAALRGEAASFPVLDHPDLDHRNKLIYQQNRGRAFEDVLRETEDQFARLLELVQALPEEDLLDPERAHWFVEPRWKSPKPLWECIADDSYRHFHQHLPDLQAWVGGGQA